MDEGPTTNLTVAKLKALCVLNDLSASGKKAELLQRLLDAGVDRETLGLEVFDEETATFQETGDETEEPADEPVMLSLEDDDTLTPDEAVEEEEQAPSASEEEEPMLSLDEDEEVLEAEILEADLIDEVPDQTPQPAESEPKTSDTSTVQATTLKEMLQRPQTVAILLTLLILGAGGWYYVNNQIEPFTADSLRYGDRMNYMLSLIHI